MWKFLKQELSTLCCYFLCRFIIVTIVIFADGESSLQYCLQSSADACAELNQGDSLLCCLVVQLLAFYTPAAASVVLSVVVELAGQASQLVVLSLAVCETLLSVHSARVASNCHRGAKAASQGPLPRSPPALGGDPRP